MELVASAEIKLFPWGQIHQPSHLCPIDILDELDYWGIVPDNYLAPCCCAEDNVVYIFPMITTISAFFPKYMLLWVFFCLSFCSKLLEWQCCSSWTFILRANVFQNDLDSLSSFSSEESPNLFKHLPLGEIRKTIWNIIEEPTRWGWCALFISSLSTL